MQPLSQSLEQDLNTFSGLPEKVKSCLILSILRSELDTLKTCFDPVFSSEQLSDIMGGSEIDNWLENQDTVENIGTALLSLRMALRLEVAALSKNTPNHDLLKYDAWMAFADGWRNIMAPLFLALEIQEKLQQSLQEWQAQEQKKHLHHTLPEQNPALRASRL